MADVAKDLNAGPTGGAAQLIVGHPFDTIKVKLQSQPVPPPFWQRDFHQASGRK
ncbi:putative mitochondrial carrier domain superfamily [Helianthus annuus]|nr:putative mitochondrial carrier domain superfamily [Helianthus annuus]KAJ0735367.1 putative mitochondrial carrier domain superfamily [Helianthus annuus]